MEAYSYQAIGLIQFETNLSDALHQICELRDTAYSNVSTVICKSEGHSVKILMRAT
jgi:hypothetical protein